jgi:hypothetical protein
MDVTQDLLSRSAIAAVTTFLSRLAGHTTEQLGLLLLERQSEARLPKSVSPIPYSIIRAAGFGTSLAAGHFASKLLHSILISDSTCAHAPAKHTPPTLVRVLLPTIKVTSQATGAVAYILERSAAVPRKGVYDSPPRRPT